MNFEKKEKISRTLGRHIGYLLMYLIFTVFLYYALSLTKKIPETWTIFHVAVITFLIIAFGILLKYIFKK
jgi:mannose/fructose/N-acetylgalactosamine-specific phosphotransferase system component IID